MSFYSSHIGDLAEFTDQGSSSEKFARSILFRLPVLARADGSVHALCDHRFLFDFTLEPGDTYIVGPHGEIVPFVAYAIRQRLLQSTNPLLFHIDAHFDRASVSPRRLSSHFDPDFPDTHSVLQYESFALYKVIDKFLSAADEDARNAFCALVSYSSGDIETFLHALQAFFLKIGACIIPENSRESLIFNPAYANHYFSDAQRVFTLLRQIFYRPSLKTVLERHPVSLFSIDADVAGSVRAPVPYQEFERRMDIVLDGLEGVRQHSQIPLFGLSIDPKWCQYPVEFLQRFFGDFYNRCILQNSLQESDLAVNG